jgi:5-methylcytosine-specific restriction protein A
MPRRSWAHAPERESRHKRGYGRQHQKLREQLLHQEPLCRPCMQKTPPRRTPATIADHIVSIAKGGAVLEEQGKRFKRRIGNDGWPCDN